MTIRTYSDNLLDAATSRRYIVDDVGSDSRLELISLRLTGSFDGATATLEISTAEVAPLVFSDAIAGAFTRPGARYFELATGTIFQVTTAGGGAQTNITYKMRGHIRLAPATAEQGILAELAAGGVDTAGSPAANEFARFVDADTIEGRTNTEVRTQLNVEDGATADQTAAEILTALLTVDGPGSLLNADFLDGSSLSDIQALIDAAVVGLYDHKGAYNAATNTPDLDTAPAGIKKGDAYTVSVAGTFYAVVMESGDVLIADQDNPTASTHWTIVNRNIDSSAFLPSSITKAQLDTAVSDGVPLFVGDTGAKRSIGIVFDGGGSPPTVGSIGYVVAQFAGNIDRWDIVGDVSGSAVVDVWKTAGAIPVNANTIAGTEKPTLSAQQLANDAALSTWTLPVAVGDVLGFELESVATCSRITCQVRVAETL